MKYYLEQCLCSVQKAVQALEAEVFVVDNASADGSLEYLQPRFPEVIFICNKTNLGYAKANNQGLALAKGRFILFLNPDIILPEDCFVKCIQFFNSNPNTGACGVRMLDGGGRFLPESKRGFPLPGTALYKLTGLASLFPRSRVFARYYLGHLDENHNHEVDVLAGAFFMARKQVLEKTGGFDEQFFMYGEDIDLSYRIGKAGHSLYYLAETSIIHFKGESTKKGNLNYVKLFYKAMLVFVDKHYGQGRLRPVARLLQAFVWCGAAVSAAANLFRRALPKKAKKSVTTIILGAEQEIEKVKAILNRREYPSCRLYEVLPHGDYVNDIKNALTDEIIFCQGVLPFKTIIKIMEELSGSSLFKIYSADSNSIISSDDKNTPGTVLV